MMFIYQIEEIFIKKERESEREREKREDNVGIVY
jgi:hypothetical protein